MFGNTDIQNKIIQIKNSKKSILKVVKYSKINSNIEKGYIITNEKKLIKYLINDNKKNKEYFKEYKLSDKNYQKINTFIEQYLYSKEYESFKSVSRGFYVESLYQNRKDSYLNNSKVYKKTLNFLRLINLFN